jgi:hypothetical protein
MPIAQDHDMIQAFSPDRADEPFDVSILPRRAGRSWSVPDAHRLHSPGDDRTVGTIVVANDVSGCLIPGKSLGDLSGNPFGGWVGGDVGPDQMASLKMDNRQSIQKLEADGPHNEQIDSGDVRRVIAKEGFPALRRRPTSSHHVFGYRRLSDVDAELEQLAMDARRTPERVLPTDPSDETPVVGR